MWHCMLTVTHFVHSWLTLDEALLSFHMASFREATLALPVVRSTDR